MTQQYPEHILKQADEMAASVIAAMLKHDETNEPPDNKKECHEIIAKLIRDTLNLPALLMAMKTLESLTPQGSEYYNDPERCAQFIRDARQSQHNQILKTHKELTQHQQVVKQLVEALERVANKTTETSIRGTALQALSTAKQLLEKKV